MDHRKKSNFAATCNLLSQYIKENKGLNLGITSLGYSSSVPVVDDDHKGKTETPRTMNLFPGVEASISPEEPKSTIPSSSIGKEDSTASQLTIFYEGKVIVIDNFPEEKVKGLMTIAGKATSTSDEPKVDRILSITSSDLPIVRRASLSKFLERRKDRVISKAPYQVNPSSSSSSADHRPSSPEKNPTWLGLARDARPSNPATPLVLNYFLSHNVHVQDD